MTDQVNEAVANLYHAVNAMLLVVGRDGEIDSRHESTAAVMQALRAIDGGQYNPELQIQATHPSRGVVDEAMVERAYDAYEATLYGHYIVETGKDNRAEAMRAALQAAALPAVPDGWKLVPKVPTTEMIGAACDTTGLPLLREATRIKREWKAMLAATPAHDQPEGEG